MPARGRDVSEKSFLNLNSGYVNRARSVQTKQGNRRPWRDYQHYLADMTSTRFGKISDGVLKFK